MSLSRTERSENIELALKLMMEELGEHGINEWSFEIDKIALREYLSDNLAILRRSVFH